VGAFVWTCEDDVEALGLRTVLRRSGCRVQAVESAGRIELRIHEEDAERAQALTGRIAAHFAEGLDAERAQTMRRADRRIHRGLWGIGAALLVGLLWLCFG